MFVQDIETSSVLHDCWLTILSHPSDFLTTQCTFLASIPISIFFYCRCYVRYRRRSGPPEAHAISCPEKVAKMGLKSAISDKGLHVIRPKWKLLWIWRHESSALETDSHLPTRITSSLRRQRWNLPIKWYGCYFKNFATQLRPQIRYPWTNLGSRSPLIRYSGTKVG